MYVYMQHTAYIYKCRIISKQFLLNGWWLPIWRKKEKKSSEIEVNINTKVLNSMKY